jgi:hypothetical protein
MNKHRTDYPIIVATRPRVKRRLYRCALLRNKAGNAAVF